MRDSWEDVVVVGSSGDEAQAARARPEQASPEKARPEKARPESAGGGRAVPEPAAPRKWGTRVRDRLFSTIYRKIVGMSDETLQRFLDNRGLRDAIQAGLDDEDDLVDFSGRHPVAKRFIRSDTVFLLVPGIPVFDTYSKQAQELPAEVRKSVFMLNEGQGMIFPKDLMLDPTNNKTYGGNVSFQMACVGKFFLLQAFTREDVRAGQRLVPASFMFRGMQLPFAKDSDFFNPEIRSESCPFLVVGLKGVVDRAVDVRPAARVEPAAVRVEPAEAPVDTGADSEEPAEAPVDTGADSVESELGAAPAGTSDQVEPAVVESQDPVEEAEDSASLDQSAISRHYSGDESGHDASEGELDETQSFVYPSGPLVNFSVDSVEDDQQEIGQEPTAGEGQDPAAVRQEQEPAAVGQEQEPAAVAQEQEPAAVAQEQEPAAVGQEQEPAAVGQEPVACSLPSQVETKVRRLKDLLVRLKAFNDEIRGFTRSGDETARQEAVSRRCDLRNRMEALIARIRAHLPEARSAESAQTEALLRTTRDEMYR